MAYEGLGPSTAVPKSVSPTGGSSSVKGYQGMSAPSPTPKTVVPFAPGKQNEFPDLAKMFTAPKVTTPTVTFKGDKTTRQIEALKGKNEVISQGKPQSGWDKFTTGVKNIFTKESDAHEFASIAVQKSIVDTQLYDIAKQLKVDEQFPKDKTVDDLTATFRQKKEVSNYMRDNWDLIRDNLKDPSAIPEHPEMMGPQFEEVNKHLDDYTKALGVRGNPNMRETVGILLTLPVASSIVAAPVAATIGLGAFTAMGAAEHYFLGDTIAGKVADALGANGGTRDVLELLELYGQGKALHMVYKKTPNIAEKFTKELITKYRPGTVIEFKPAQIRDIFQTGTKMSKQEVEMWSKLGRTPEQVKRDIANGVTIEIPPEKVMTLVDRPYWAKIKGVLGIKTNPVEVSRTALGEAKESFTQRLLPAGETKLKTITQELLNETKKNIGIHGSEVTAMALTTSLGIEASLANEIIRAAQTPSLGDDAKLISQNILNQVAPKGYQGMSESEVASLETTAIEKPLPTEEVVAKTETIEAPKTTELSPDMQARKTSIDARRDYFDNNPLNQLIKYQSSSRPGELPEFTGTGKGKFGKEGDKIIDEIMGYKDAYKNANDVAEVSKRFESYVKEKKAFEAEEAQLKKEIGESKREAASINAVAEAAKEPVIEGPRSELKSRVFERLQAEHGDKLEGDLVYDKNTREKDVEGALKLLEEDPQQAFRVAMNAEAVPETTSTMMNIAMSEKALQEGNVKLFAQLTRNRSLAQTRRGQEIEAEKASVTNNTTSRYVKELLQARLENLGNEYLTKVGSTTKRVAKGKVKGGSPKERAIERIDKEIAKAQKAIPKSAKELDLAEAQAIIDSLTC